MFHKIVILICVLFLMYSPAAFAGGKNPDSCKAVGSVVVRCYDCGSERSYLGNVAVLTDYEEDQGKKYCVKASVAKQACANKFGVSSYCIDFYTKYSLGMSTYTEFYNTTCVEEVGGY